MDLWRVIVAGVDPSRLRPSSALEISNQFMIRPDRRCAGAVPCTYNMQDSAAVNDDLRAPVPYYDYVLLLVISGNRQYLTKVADDHYSGQLVQS
jgi:hypothetical protein